MTEVKELPVEGQAKVKKSEKDENIVNMHAIMERFDKLDAQAFDLSKVAKEYKKLPKKTKAKINKAAQKLARGNPNLLERAVYYAEDITGGYLPAIGKVAGYGFLGYKVGELGYLGFKKAMNYLKP